VLIPQSLPSLERNDELAHPRCDTAASRVINTTCGRNDVYDFAARARTRHRTRREIPPSVAASSDNGDQALKLLTPGLVNSLSDSASPVCRF